MKTTLTEFLKAAHKKGLNLENLIDLSQKDRKYNVEIPDIDDDAMSVMTTEQIIHATKVLNGEITTGSIGKKKL